MARPVITDKPILDQAEFNGVTIWRKEGGSIEVSDINYPSMKAALLDIAQKAGINVEKGWNTQYLGWYIIQQLKKSGSAKAIMIEPVKVEVKKQAAEAPVIDVAPVKGERDGELIIELKEPGTLMSIIVNNGVDMAAIKCLTLKGAAPNQGDKKLIKTIADSYHALETLDLSDVQMETVEGFSEIAVKVVILPKCAVSIGEKAFYKCKALNRVTIPASVTAIGKAAFKSCSSLKQVAILGSKIIIEVESFWDCPALERMEISSKMPFRLNARISQYEYIFGIPDNLKIYVPKGTLPFFKMSWSDYSSRIVESEE
ncbi:MAG: leucine-rich repeat domain-containing protein [Candidatus Cryptobacteroides sp.]|nr:leucine-rich repeat domain-containing protein [Candidatus Cryptobacteroides sp.]